VTCDHLVVTDDNPQPHPLRDQDGIDQLRQGVDLEAYGDGSWVVADVPAAGPGRILPADHVLGVSGASTTLAGATVRTPSAPRSTSAPAAAYRRCTWAPTPSPPPPPPSASAHCASPRPPRHCPASNGNCGTTDLAAPVDGQRFDLVVSNPPFVVRSGVATHTYRDSGRAGDALGAELAALAARLLTGAAATCGPSSGRSPTR
jgi:hypothetical protein